jgi:uncharacterized SAM-binding protein YcdF (DUF218 family)
MFFALSKILWFFLRPSALMALALIWGIVLSGCGHWRDGRRWLVGGLLALLVCGLTPMSDLLYLPLEARFQRADVSKSDVAGIIVLGGAQDARADTTRELMPLQETGERMTEAVALARRLPGARLVFSGGSDAFFHHAGAEADVAGRLFVAMGIDPARLTLENRSRTTAENAQFSKALVQPKPGTRWILITSAWHMPRAIGSFRAAGFPVEPWPVDYRTPRPFNPLRFFDNFPEGLHHLDFVAKEYVGLLAYRLSGRTDELFPGPLTTTPP